MKSPGDGCSRASPRGGRGRGARLRRRDRVARRGVNAEAASTVADLVVTGACGSSAAATPTSTRRSSKEGLRRGGPLSIPGRSPSSSARACIAGSRIPRTAAPASTTTEDDPAPETAAALARSSDTSTEGRAVTLDAPPEEPPAGRRQAGVPWALRGHSFGFRTSTRFDAVEATGFSDHGREIVGAAALSCFTLGPAALPSPPRGAATGARTAGRHGSGGGTRTPDTWIMIPLL